MAVKQLYFNSKIGKAVVLYTTSYDYHFRRREFSRKWDAVISRVVQRKGGSRLVYWKFNPVRQWKPSLNYWEYGRFQNPGATR